MRVLPRLLFRFAVGASLAAGMIGGAGAADAGFSHPELRRVAEAAYARKDFDAAREAYAAALALRPDSPRYLHRLAATQALTGKESDALATLRRLTALGIATAVERDPDFATLQGTPAFNAIRTALAANREPRGEADLLVELPGRTGIIEGIAFRERTGDLFLGDAHHRCIWRRNRDGQIARYTAEDESLFGVFGLAIDEPRGALWAATTALPEMSGFTKEQKGHAALAEFSLVNSELRRLVEVPGDGRDHALGDLLVTSEGVVFAADSVAPVIWRYIPGAEEMEKLVEHPDFVSLQGMALSGQTLLVADYANGLFAVDLSTSTPVVRALAPPPHTTLLGLDGLVAVPGGLVAVQNGVTTQRVVRITLDAGLTAITGVTVLASALPRMDDLALVTLVNGRPTFIANAGWDSFDPAKAEHPPAHAVRIFQTAAP
ncbi:MAG: hypothetical protein NTV51_03960 [Verrucomicrobia bacterium]|nr:hypothetical protein [Verrucomicrobiota bacterium]